MAAGARLNEANFADMPVDHDQFAGLRTRVLSAIATNANSHSDPEDALATLVNVWEQAPQNAAIVLEMAKAAARAKDNRKLQRFAQIAEPLVADQPQLRKALDQLLPKREKANPKASKGTLRRLEAVDLADVCAWIKQSFAQGRPPVADVGPQGTEVIDCQTLTRFDLTPEVQALPVVAAARGHGQRTFGWVAAKWRNSVWLSPSIVESFAPSFHPNGNGFAIELQRASVFRDGVPELSAFITERRTDIDPALNEKRTQEQHRLVVMTFDLDPPQVSPSVVLHTKSSVNLVDPSDTSLPKGYKHSANLGKVEETAYTLAWGKNLARLTPTEPNAAPIEQTLFVE